MLLVVNAPQQVSPIIFSVPHVYKEIRLACIKAFYQLCNLVISPPSVHPMVFFLEILMKEYPLQESGLKHRHWEEYFHLVSAIIKSAIDKVLVFLFATKLTSRASTQPLMPLSTDRQEKSFPLFYRS